MLERRRRALAVRDDAVEPAWGHGETLGREAGREVGRRSGGGSRGDLLLTVVGACGGRSLHPARRRVLLLSELLLGELLLLDELLLLGELHRLLGVGEGWGGESRRRREAVRAVRGEAELLMMLLLLLLLLLLLNELLLLLLLLEVGRESLGEGELGLDGGAVHRHGHLRHRELHR